ncbi:hypothetical protein [Jiella mangrovi]|uniref:DUF4760 domain-containing protein n=1 Tax=Jiella mangrovi TaxID=2821407 RepID=A0ABS4BC90_9HYPH|nr:hypothetical protein [Jiella mangrovi]MBP0614365.1 hypothetical protein [Jiella mangrovi]
MKDFFIWLGIVDVPLQQAVITGFLGFAGALLAGLIAIGTWVGSRVAHRREEDRRRKQEQRDVQTAIMVEIDAVWRQWVVLGSLDESLEAVETAFADNPDFVPFVTPVVQPAVFEAFIPKIAVLDEQAIGPVVAFYRQMMLINRFSGDLRSAAYRSLGHARRKRMLQHYSRMVATVTAMAEDAMEAIERSLETKPQERLQERKKVLLSKMEADRKSPASAAAAPPASGPNET